MGFVKIYTFLSCVISILFIRHDHDELMDPQLASLTTIVLIFLSYLMFGGWFSKSLKMFEVSLLCEFGILQFLYPPHGEKSDRKDETIDDDS
jgi:hypothetical protein